MFCCLYVVNVYSLQDCLSFFWRFSLNLFSSKNMGDTLILVIRNNLETPTKFQGFVFISSKLHFHCIFSVLFSDSSKILHKINNSLHASEKDPGGLWLCFTQAPAFQDTSGFAMTFDPKTTRQAAKDPQGDVHQQPKNLRFQIRGFGDWGRFWMVWSL